jgi:hypothetical protein
LYKIASVTASLAESTNDHSLLVEAIKTAERIDEIDSSKADALVAIAKSITKLSDPSNNRTLYDKTFSFIEGFREDRSRDPILNGILMACSHPELIGKEKESEDDNDQ